MNTRKSARERAKKIVKAEGKNASMMIRLKNSVMDADIKTSHLFWPMKKLFIIRDICEGTYGSLITGNNMTSHRMGSSMKLNSGLKMKLNGTFKRT